jgi:predicted dehydrogenase
LHQPDEGYIAEWEHFLDCVKANRVPSITGVDGLKVLQMIEAARCAAASRYQILVPT